MKDGTVALPAAEKIARGKMAIQALADYRAARKAGNEMAATNARAVLDENFPYFGYGYIKDVKELIPPVALTFYAFRIMVSLGGLFILVFALAWWLGRRGQLAEARWMHWVAILTVPLAYIAAQAGWIVAEVGRQPLAIQDILPNCAAISKLEASSVQVTFFLFLILFTVLLIAELGIMAKAIQKGPEQLH